MRALFSIPKNCKPSKCFVQSEQKKKSYRTYEIQLHNFALFKNYILKTATLKLASVHTAIFKSALSKTSLRKLHLEKRQLAKTQRTKEHPENETFEKSWLLNSLSSWDFSG
jgi:hypothetical protein